MTRIRETLSDASIDWTKRVDAVMSIAVLITYLLICTLLYF